MALFVIERDFAERPHVDAQTITSFQESGVMVDEFAESFPALAAISLRLAERVGEEIADETGQAHVVMGCVVGFLTLIENGHTETMRHQFDDPLEPCITIPPGTVASGIALL